MAVLHLLCHAMLVLPIPLFKLIQHDFGLARVEPVTALGTALALTFALATLGTGWLCDRAPGRWIAGVGLVFHGLGLIGMARSPSLGWATFWLVVAGIGSAGYHPVAARQVVGLYPEAVGKAMGVQAIGSALGFWIGPRFAGWRADHAGWRAPVFEAGVVAVIVAITYLLCTIEPVLPGHDEPAGGNGAERSDKLLMVVALGLLGVLLIPRDFAGMAYDALNALFLQHAEGYRLSVDVVGGLLGAKGLLSLVSNPLMAWLSDRGHRLWWWAATIAASACCGLLVPWLPPPAAKLSLVLCGMFFLANYPVFEAALLERIPPRLRGRGYALVLTIVGVFAAFSYTWVGGRVDHLVAGAAAVTPERFRPIYALLSVALISSLAAIPLLNLVGRRGDRIA